MSLTWKKNQDGLIRDQKIWGGVNVDSCISMTESREHGNICQQCECHQRHPLQRRLSTTRLARCIFCRYASLLYYQPLHCLLKESMRKVAMVVQWRLCMGSTIITFPADYYLGIVSAECLIYQQLMSILSPQYDITSWRTATNRWQLITLGHFHLGGGRNLSSLK